MLAGLHISTDTMKILNPAIDKAKINAFGTKNVELHSSSLRNPHQLKKQYLDKYNITAEKLRHFINDVWYPIFSNYPIQTVAIIVDKRYFKNARHSNISPLEIAAEALFDRTEIHPCSDCNIVFDQMDSEIKSQTDLQGKVLQISNTKIDLANGKYKNKYSHSSVSFEKSSNSNFLQLADMVAYNTWRQFVDYGNEWNIHSPIGKHRSLPMYKYFDIISSNFYHNKNNRINGFGIIKLPDPFNKKRGWNLGQ